MITFSVSLVCLLIGYLIYGTIVERIIRPSDSTQMPCYTKQDGVDFIPMPAWRVFLIQFLNIAGTGPIFGAIMGAKFGPASYLWIVLGCIFAGAVHDYLSGMLSVRHDGASLPDLIGKYLGQGTKKVMLVFTVILLILVGAVFVYSPSLILGDIAGDGSRNAIMIWAVIIFAYYLIATILPIDKIIGKIYPIFAMSLIFMAIALMVGLFIKWPEIPEIWDGLANRGPELGVKGQPIFPCLFITIACGAISGFHATQSPLMARCMKNEKLGRPIFYGSMITEGLVALIWATISSYFFFAGGAEEVGSSLSAAAPTVVTAVSKGWLGVLGGILAILGVVAAPITTGDTALRSCRLIVADAVHYDQKPVRSRLALCVPIFLATALILWFNIANEDGFNVIWRYFGWANQTLSIFTLWALTVYLARNKGGLAYMITLIPALLMTSVCTTYICTAKIGFNLPMDWNIAIGTAVAGLSALLFGLWLRREKVRKS